MKRIKNSILTIIVFFFGIISVVNAEELNTDLGTHTVDFTKKGSIKITLTEEQDDEAISGAEITIYKVASAREENHNLKFTYTEEFSTCEASLDNLEDTELTKQISKCAKELSPDLVLTTNNEGVVKFTDLDLGLYLVTQSNHVEGYSNIDSFLVMIPKVEDNKWIYNIKSEPKTDIYRTIDLQVIKVWNKQNKNTKLPDSVTIELYKDEELIDIIKLNEANNWTYTWDDIEKSDSYNVVEIDIPKGYTATYTQEGYVFTVTNTDKLAQTGRIYLPIIILASLGSILILAGIFEFKKETNE